MGKTKMLILPLQSWIRWHGLSRRGYSVQERRGGERSSSIPQDWSSSPDSSAVSTPGSLPSRFSHPTRLVWTEPYHGCVPSSGMLNRERHSHPQHSFL